MRSLSMTHVDPLSVVPSGTTIDMRITLPKERGSGSAGYRWRAPETMPAADVRGEVARDLVPRFFRNFLPREE